MKQLKSLTDKSITSLVLFRFYSVKSDWVPDMFLPVWGFGPETQFKRAIKEYYNE